MLPEHAPVHLQPAASETMYGSEPLQAVTPTKSCRARLQLAADCFALMESDLPFQTVLPEHL